MITEPKSCGVYLIADERARQINVEGWAPEHDDAQGNEQLARAAACYAMPAIWRRLYRYVPLEWPFGADWWKPTPDDRIRELVKAGALIAAEIDRLLRKPAA